MDSNNNEIVKNGACQACPSGEGPDENRATCLPCNSNEISTIGFCQACLTGEVPNGDQTTCIACNENEITNAGICQACPTAEIPNGDQTACIACHENKDWVGDGFCDDATNIIECNYDGGDCCGYDINTKHCKKCQCHEGGTYFAFHLPFISRDQAYSLLLSQSILNFLLKVWCWFFH